MNRDRIEISIKIKNDNTKVVFFFQKRRQMPINEQENKRKYNEKTGHGTILA